MKADYLPTIGLEIHAELKTETKMFCACPNDQEEREPNKNICPVCMGHPGSLPSANREAIKKLIAVGMALGGEIQLHSKFDRKSYFYPDLPKGYQISQYDMPLVKGGSLAGIPIERIHIEEDTARLAHAREGSMVDFNRAGIPLMELVTKPAIDSSDKALEFAKELQLILRYLGASDADMENGQMRVEANVSLRKIADARDGAPLGTKVELKNINSFRAAKNAVEYEIKRQAELLENGGKVAQETRGWDESKGETFSQRSKEEAHDYRYMPEPDLPPMDFSISGGINIEEIKKELPELPSEKRDRFKREYGFKDADALERMIRDRGEARFFEEVMSELGADAGANIAAVTNYIDSDLVGLMNREKITWENLKISPENFAEFIAYIRSGKISTRTAKDVLVEMFETGVDPTHIISEGGLEQVSDIGEIMRVIEEVLAENEKAVKDYRGGKESTLKFLVGQTMAKLRGRGNPEQLEKLLLDALSK